MPKSSVEVLGDKGFLRVGWQAQIHEQTGNWAVTPKRKNLKIQHSDGFKRLLNTVLERLEAVFYEVQNTGRNAERLMAKTVIGLTTRLIAKVTAYLLRHILKVRYAIEIQSFQAKIAFSFHIRLSNVKKRLAKGFSARQHDQRL